MKTKLMIAAAFALSGAALWAQEAAPPVEEAAAPFTADEAAYAIDNLFLLIAAVLVLLMQAGFAMLESGMNSSRCAVNVLSKNLMDMCIGVVVFWIIGYGLMYPGESNGYLGFAGFGASTEAPAEVGPGVLHPQLDFLFQAAFAAATATIVSGAIAGRMNFFGYLIASFVITGFFYPIQGMWKWGGGFLDGLGYVDFAGCMVVHGMGGFSAIAAAIVLGPRLGRFVGGKSKPIPGHSMPLATLGVFLLVVGFYGFNPGSQLAISTPDDVAAVMKIAVNTTLAAGAGGIGALALIWVITKKADLSMALNGVLGGLVSICTACDALGNGQTIVLALIAGAVVVGGVYLLEKLKIDDPVGAFPVHGLCGVLGVLAPPLFGLDGFTIGAQLTGFAVIAIFAFVTSFGLFTVLRLFGIARVSAEVESEGLDVVEHGMEAYAITAE